MTLDQAFGIAPSFNRNRRDGAGGFVHERKTDEGRNRRCPRPPRSAKVVPHEFGRDLPHLARRGGSFRVEGG